jgi:hypothetical protein
MPGEKWIARQKDDRFWLEANFLTLRGAERSLRRAGFVRNHYDLNNFRSYFKFWFSEVYAVARIRPKTSRTSRIKVTISYYNGRGERFRELGSFKTQHKQAEHRKPGAHHKELTDQIGK